MRYIADSNGCIKGISFGADIVCEEQACTEYTGTVPSEYGSIEDWFSKECECLYRWKIIGGNLTLDPDAAEPKQCGPFGMTLLWENASPTSVFAAQTIALDLAEYDAVQIEFDESWQTMSARINVGKHGGVDQIGDIYRDVAAYFYVAHRDISVTTTGVSFADRLYKYANGQWHGMANQGLIPFRIYGIQGVGA